MQEESGGRRKSYEGAKRERTPGGLTEWDSWRERGEERADFSLTVVIEALAAAIIGDDEVIMDGRRSRRVAWLRGAVAHVGKKRLPVPRILPSTRSNII